MIKKKPTVPKKSLFGVIREVITPTQTGEWKPKLPLPPCLANTDLNKKMFTDIVEWMIKSDKNILYESVASRIFAVDGNWNDDTWMAFLREFVLLSREIAVYFNVDNKFAVNLTDKYVKYEGNHG
jgi:hypothetical protein